MKGITERTKPGGRWYVFVLGWLSLVEAVIEILSLGRLRATVVVPYIQKHLLTRFENTMEKDQKDEQEV